MDGLLLGEGELLEVVDALALQAADVGSGGVHGREGAVLGGLLGQAGAVHLHAVSEDGEQHVVLVQLEVLGHLDGGEHVADATDAQEAELLNGVLVHAQAGEVALAFRLVEEAQDAHAVFVIDGRHGVGVADVVNPGHVLVADALDAVVTEAVHEQGGALDGLGGHDLGARVQALEVVPGGDGAGAARGADVASKAGLVRAQTGEHILDGRARDVVVPHGVTVLLELVEDQVLGVSLQLPALVVDLFHVALAARGRDDLGADLGQPGEALLAHVLRQDGDGGAAQHGGVEGAAATVVPGRGPDSLVVVRVELAAHQARHEAREGGADLVGAGGEVLPDQADNAGLHTGDGAGDLQVVGAAEQTRLRIVLPGDAEEVGGVDVPEAHILEAGLHGLGGGLGAAHLAEGGDDDAPVLAALGGALDDFGVVGFHDSGHGLSVPRG